MTKRKIFLLAADVLLLCICIVQCVAGSKNNIKNFVLKEEPDEFVITNAGETIPLILEGENWIVGEQKYPASNQIVESFISAISEIKALDKVGDISNEKNLERYDLTESKRICIEAKKAGKTLRTLYLGKEATAGSQCYATIDDNKNIYILAGTVRMTFDKSISKMRSNAVLDLDKPLISSVTLKPVDAAAWTVSRSGSGDNVVYSVEGADITLDNQKAGEYLDSFCALTTNNWYAENTDLGGSKKVDVEIIYNNEKITLEVFEIPGTEETQNLPLYYGNSSATPYTFNIGNYAAARYLTKPEDLSK